MQDPGDGESIPRLFSLSYRLGMENGRVPSNPARLVRMRKEDHARLRFLNRDEYKKLSEIILRDSPKQHAAFVVSVYTGMRWGEQFSLTWSQVDLKRKIIRLTQAKNGSARNVPLNSAVLEALQHQQSGAPTNPPILYSLSTAIATVAGDGSSPRSLKRRSLGTLGTTNGTPSARGWQWPGSRSKRFEPWRATRPSQ